MTHQPTLAALGAATYWLEAHPDLPTPSVYAEPESVVLTWTFRDRQAVLDLLRDFDGWTFEPTAGSTTGQYVLNGGVITLNVFDRSMAAQSVNLLDALAEVA